MILERKKKKKKSEDRKGRMRIKYKKRERERGRETRAKNREEGSKADFEAGELSLIKYSKSPLIPASIPRAHTPPSSPLDPASRWSKSASTNPEPFRISVA